MSAQNSDSDGLDDARHGFPRRPCVHAFAGVARERGKLRGTAEQFLKTTGQRIGVTDGINIAREAGTDEIEAAADLIAQNNWTTAEHSFANNHWTRIVIRGQNKEIGGGVNGREAALVDETEKTNTIADAQRDGFGFELLTLRALSSKREDSIRDSGFGKSAKKVKWALPRLEFCAEENHRLVGRDAPRGAHGSAIDLCGLHEPPIVVGRERRERHAILRNAEREDEVSANGGGCHDLVGERKEMGPENLFDANLPGAGIARSKRGSIGAKEKCRAGESRGEIGDPKAGPDIADVGDYGIESTFADQAPKTGIAEPEERFLAGTTIGDMRPRVTVEKRNIPLDGGAKFRIVGSFGSAQIAIRNMNINFRAGSETPENWRAVLNRLGSHKKDLQASLRHKGTFYIERNAPLPYRKPANAEKRLRVKYSLLV